MQPPRLAEWLVRKLVGGRDGDVVAGDLAEEFDARGGGALWYWRQTASCLFVRLSPYRRAIPDLGRDFTHALRMMRRNPGYAAVAMICLALGIGVNTAVFSFLDGMFLRRLPVPDAHRVVMLDREGAPPFPVFAFFEIKKSLRTVPQSAALITRQTFLDVGTLNSRIQLETVTANYADILRTRPQVGRWFAPADEAPGGGFPVVISDRIWDRYFDRRSNVLGQTVRIENKVYEIIGVADRQFHGVTPPMAIDAWVPIVSFPMNRAQFSSTTDAAGPEVSVIGRLAPGVSIAQAQSEMNVIDAAFKKSPRRDRLATQPLRVHIAAGFASRQARKIITPLAALLSGVAGVVLLIACVNVANLLLSRAVVRRHEMSVRLALGATRGRLIRQSLAEGLAIAAGGALLGLVAGFWTDQAIAYWLPSFMPDAPQFSVFLDVNWRVAAATTAVSILSALLFSLAPTFERTSPDFSAIAQVALSLLLLISAGLLIRALDRAASTSPGFATAHRMYLRVFSPQRDLFTRLVDDAKTIPGVRQATLSFTVLGFSDNNCAAITPTDTPRKLGINVVEPNYFEVMQVPLVRGRNFNGNKDSVIVNETMARQFWPDRDAVGQRVWFGCDPQHERLEAEVIGVARDSKYIALDEAPTPVYYVSQRESWWNGYFALIVETAAPYEQVSAELIKRARTMGGPKLRIYETETFDNLVSTSLWHTRFYALLLSAFSALAIALAAFGLFGVVAYSVAQRTREFGIRIAMGASTADVQWMVLGKAVKLTTVGIGVGLALSAAATQFLRQFLQGVSPLDPITFVTAALTWLLIALLASYIPSRRATRVDPNVALRYE